MTTGLLHFSIPPERLGHDAARYLDPEIGPSWPLESHKVTLYDLKPELETPDESKTLMDQLNSRGFAVLKNKSDSLGTLQDQTEWNAAYLEVRNSPESHVSSTRTKTKIYSIGHLTNMIHNV